MQESYQSANQLNTSDAHDRIHKCVLDLEARGNEKRKQFRQKLTSCRNRIRALKFCRDDDSSRQLEDARDDLNEILAG